MGSSVPQHRIPQGKIGAFMKRHMALDEKRMRWTDLLVRQSGIGYRHSVVPDYGRDPEDFEFYPRNQSLDPFPSVGMRMEYYRRHALPLAAAAARKCLSTAGVEPSGITHLVVVSCTGMYAPGLDIDLVKELGMAGSVSRTCIHFMGCYAAFNALKVAASAVVADPSARVLVVCVELCSIHFQKSGTDGSNLLTNMLFADGASASLVEAEKPAGRPSLALLDFASALFPEGEKDMTWEIADSGFAMKLTGRVPEILGKEAGAVFKKLCAGWTEKGNPVRHYAFHPGGPRVLEALERAWGLTAADNRWSYEVLREFGNMSSATLFFIFGKLLGKGELSDGDLVLSAAFGPGLTCESALMAVAV